MELSIAIDSTHHKEHFKPLFKGRGCPNQPEYPKDVFERSSFWLVPTPSPPSKVAKGKTLPVYLISTVPNGLIFKNCFKADVFP